MPSKLSLRHPQAYETKTKTWAVLLQRIKACVR